MAKHPQFAKYLSVVAGAALATSAWASARDEVRVDSGALKGVVAGKIVSFKGVPYAAPPVGDLRWRAPQPPASWQGVRAADRFGAMCMQTADPFARAAELPPQSEDCLTLNVWTAASSPSAKLPVMVWIHGGSFSNGTGAAPVCDGSSLAGQGVVVVTLNYRLGRFGFFAHLRSLARRRRDPSPTTACWT